MEEAPERAEDKGEDDEDEEEDDEEVRFESRQTGAVAEKGDEGTVEWETIELEKMRASRVSMFLARLSYSS